MKPAPTRRLVVASRNQGKVAEIRSLLSSLPEADRWEITGVPDAVPEPDETGKTFEANAILKALEYARRAGTSVWTLADDSGLEVDALGGRPGVHSSRYAPTDAERIARLLAELEGIPEGKRTARFVSALALVTENKVVWTGRGEVAGRITTAPRGTNGFGYDPIFRLPDGRTMAELDPEAKNRISHRGRALEKLVEHLRSRRAG